MTLVKIGRCPNLTGTHACPDDMGSSTRLQWDLTFSHPGSLAARPAQLFQPHRARFQWALNGTEREKCVSSGPKNEPKREKRS
eukprot:1149369-Pelagomonas_calceolata.AAC.2